MTGDRQVARNEGTTLPPPRAGQQDECGSIDLEFLQRARVQVPDGQLKTRRGADGGTCIEVCPPRRDREAGKR
ncbi:hypothetical protein ACFJIW_03260 [Tahibacter sp. UC22_41]|uniref:hypothetical protein n=1 Tax=Tahibacter sp. UC22_41 TaxID=3350178 RepID=UPI0036D9D297